MNKKYLLLTPFFLLFGFQSKAQHPLVLQKLTEWNDAAPVLSNEKLRQEVLGAAKNRYSTSDACSNSEVIIDRVHPATADRFIFLGLVKQQLRNAWTVNTRLPGCDEAPVRFMVIQNKDNSLKTIRVNRGISYAWDSLISDTLPNAHIAAVARLKRAKHECELGSKFKLGVTQLKSEGDGLGADVFGVRYTGSWDEIWPIITCGKTVEVLIKFTADGDGGAFSNLPGDQAVILSD